jgi:meso-butanediol dehydrogenase/(S,S)-butanediol dehydrogenase/diacetyl reductase
MRLENKNAIITGSAGGLGAAVAERFAQNCANVALWDMNEKGLEEMESRLKRYGF